MRSARRGDPADRGSVTAEFAVALPAVLLLLAVLLGGIRLGGLQLLAQDAAADAARALGRGEGDAAVRSRLAGVLPGASLAVDRGGDLVCVHVGVPPAGLAALAPIRLAAHSCAHAAGG